MAYTPHTFYGDGSTTDFIYTFDVLGAFSNVIVKTQVVGGLITQLTEGLEYDLITPKTVRFNTGYIPVGTGVDGSSTLISITRLTSRSRLIDYIPGGTIRERDLDNDYNRLTSVDEEIENGVFAALFKNDAGTFWDAEGLRSDNSSPALTATGWTTLAQVQDLVSGLNVADLAIPIILTFTGDGVETEFELQGIRGGIPGQADIYVNSIYQTSDQATAIYTILQEADSDYPSGGDGFDYLQFSVPPPLGATIEVKHFTGTVLGVLPAEFVNIANQIANNLVGLQHLELPSGDAKRFIIFDDTGKIPVGRTIGIEDLVATSQLIGAAVRTAFTNDASGLRLSDFLRANAGNLDIKGFKLLDVGAPSSGGDATNKTYVDANKIQLAKGAINTGLPNGLGATMDITVGFQPDFFFFLIHHTGGPHSGSLRDYSSKHFFIAGGPTHQETMSPGYSVNGDASLISAFITNAQTSTKMRVENRSLSFGQQLTTITSVTWFALKLGV